MDSDDTARKGPRFHIHSSDVEWGDYSAYYPAEMMQTMRGKRLFGPGGGVHRDDMLLGILELDPGAVYPLHSHPAPEVYYVMQGEAECQFGDERFRAKPGTAIYTEPNLPHGFRNTGPGKFVALGFWWAPGGDTASLKGDLALTGEG